jgi:hypothetical protein
MELTDEIPLEDHRYFRARLDHLETTHPMALLALLEAGTLTSHLREVTGRGMQAKAELVINRNLPQDQADELVMNQVVADPQEQSRLNHPTNRKKLRTLLDRYKATLPNLPRTYLSQSEITE